MIEEIENKLEIISKVYSHYILNYKECRKSTRFQKDRPAYSFSETMSYLGDTLGIISQTPKIEDFISAFAYHISLLQAIYVQQDLVLELLYLVNCDLDKGDLKKDSNYTINRDIRNELVGHPIRKVVEKIENSEKKKTVLLSSVLMDIHSNSKVLAYARYHKDNNYEFEKLTFKISDIIERHYSFLNNYLDIIISKFKSILADFSERVSNIIGLIDKKPFELILKLVKLHFESIFESRYCYDEDSLVQIYARKEENERFLFFIETFIKELKDQLEETVREIPFEFKKRIWANIEQTENIPISLTHHYELGKLATKRNKMDFDFFSGLLRLKCENDDLVQLEIDNMENNIYKPIEYYSSLNLIRRKLLKINAST